jgi:DNA gyrase subunit A
MATKDGLVKKTEFAQFESIRKGGKIAISLNEGDELIGVELVDDSDNVLLAASSGKCIRFSTTDVRSMGRDTMGVKSINISGDDKVVDMAIIREGVEQEVFTITENGYGKRTDVSDYRLQSRAGKGVKAGNFNEQTGGLVNLKLISPNDDIMLIADNGIIMRVRATEISKISRDTKGVRIMTLKNEGKVVCAAVTEHEELEENAENVEGEETSENAVETPVDNNDVPASENTEE